MTATLTRTVRERGILMSGEMVRATLDRRKTKTRRVILPQVERGEKYEASDPWLGHDGKWHWQNGVICYAENDRNCPYGQPGDRLYVRETWALNSVGVAGPPWVHSAEIGYRADDGEVSHRCPAEFVRVERERIGTPPLWRPSIHMPRWASRLTVELTDVRVERVQDISEEDAIAEGVDCVGADNSTHRAEFMRLWDSLNAKRGYGWGVNPWVWCLSFRQVVA